MTDRARPTIDSGRRSTVFAKSTPHRLSVLPVRLLAIFAGIVTFSVIIRVCGALSSVVSAVAIAALTAVASALTTVALRLATFSLAIVLALWLLGRSFTLINLRGTVVPSLLTFLAAVISLCLTRLLLFLLFLVETTDAVLSHKVAVSTLGLLLAITVGKQVLRLLAVTVHLNDFAHSLGRERDGVNHLPAVGRIGHFALIDVSFYVIVRSVGGLESNIFRRQFTRGFHVAVHLEVYAALQLGTLPGEFLRVKRDVLKTSGTRRHRHEIGHPRRATQRTAARADATDTSGLLTGTNLLHLNAYLEDVGQHLDELAEIDASVGDIIENRLIAVALILYIADFHIQPEFGCNLAGAYHRVGLARLRLFEAFKVGSLRFAEDTQNLGVLAVVGALHLQLDQTPRHGHSADVVPRIGLHCHHVALVNVKVSAVAIEAATRILEMHLDKVIIYRVTGDVGKPVAAMQIAARLSGTPVAARLATLETLILIGHRVA